MGITPIAKEAIMATRYTRQDIADIAHQIIAGHLEASGYDLETDGYQDFNEQELEALQELIDDAIIEIPTLLFICLGQCRYAG